MGNEENMYEGIDSELLGITFYTNPPTTRNIDRRTESQ